MIQSMTGYHKLSFNYAEKTIHIEIKTLNSKYLDINTRIPSVYKEKELAIRELIHNKLTRGKVEYNIYVDLSGSSSSTVLNQDLFIDYYNQLKEIAQKANIPFETDAFAVISKMPDIMKQERQEIEDEEWNNILAKTNECLDMVIQYRKDEGISLDKDIRQSTQNIQNMIYEVEPFEANRIEEVKKNLSKQLEKLPKSIETDKNRFEQELIYYLEKLDINEEKVRLRNHCNYFIETLNADTSSGKKLGFIAQEMGREINTMGSKANDSNIQKIVVQMKDELEKIKEQVLNIV